MIEIHKTYPDGRVFKYHKIGEPLIDLNANKISAIIKSWERKADCEANTPEYVLFVCEIGFSEWDASILDELHTLILTPPWQPFKSIFVEPVTTTLEDAKAKKRAWINEKRDLIEKQGFPYLEKFFDSNIIGSARLSMAIHAANSAMMLDMPFSIDWTTSDNTEITLDAEQMLYLPLVFAGYANELHLHAKAKKALVDAATTIEQVEAITW